LWAAVSVAPAAAGRQDASGVNAEAAAPVVVRVAIVEKAGRPASDLRAEDLRVTIDGAEQKIVSLTSAADEPLHLVVMLDASASQERVLPRARQAAAEFVAALLRPGRDDAAVVRFTGDPEVVEGLTGDLASLRRAFASVNFVPPAGYVGGGTIVLRNPPPKNAMPAGSTAIWDSLVFVCDKLFAKTRGGRRAAVLVTDGVDTSSRVGADSAVERLIREGVAVYSVGVGDEHSFDGVKEGGLRKVSERTGGRALFPKDGTRLADSFEQARRGLLSTYTLALAPQALKGGKSHKLRVELVNPELYRHGVSLTYPQSLYAAARP
jgi:VWFA-related protein